MDINRLQNYYKKDKEIEQHYNASQEIILSLLHEASNGSLNFMDKLLEDNLKEHAKSGEKLLVGGQEKYLTSVKFSRIVRQRTTKEQ